MYDINDYEKTFVNEIEFCEMVDSLVKKDQFVGIVAKKEITDDIFAWLASHKYKIEYVSDYEPYYSDEYLITVTPDRQFYVEQFKAKSESKINDGMYLLTDVDIMYVHDDCNHRVMLENPEIKKIAFHYDVPVAQKLCDCGMNTKDECGKCKNKTDEPKKKNNTVHVFVVRATAPGHFLPTDYFSFFRNLF